MRLSLTRHCDTPCDAVTRIDVDVARGDNGVLRLDYAVHGTIDDLRLPPPTMPVRADDLWKHTCLEAFVGTGEGYIEFNLSPSTEWAAYCFDAYRAGMRAFMHNAVPQFAVHIDPTHLALRAELDLHGVDITALGLSAVIEETSGRKSYWALAHPPGKPDFHHADCFAAQIPAASAS